jgi:hypothetical protein
VTSTEDVVMVKLENHGERPVFVSSGLSFQRDDSERLYWIGMDATGSMLPKRAVAPGDGFTVTIPASALKAHAGHLATFFFLDEIGRRFESDREVTQNILRRV